MAAATSRKMRGPAATPAQIRPGALHNHLLDALPVTDFERLRPHFERVTLNLGDVLYEPGGRMRYVYFPTTAIVSLLYVMADGASAEIAIVGNEGILGIALFMGGESTPSRAVVQSAGSGYRMKAALLKVEFGRFGALMHLLLRYTQALITQMAQTAVCNRHHSVDQQLCRWLLLSLDRLSSNQLIMTQELIANMLGVRREGVTEAAGKLQAAGLIQLPARQDHGAGSRRAGSALVRVLPRGQKGARPPIALQGELAPAASAKWDSAHTTRRQTHTIGTSAWSGRPLPLHSAPRKVPTMPDRPALANRILASVPSSDYRRLNRQLEPVTLRFGQVLYEPGVAIRYVYFPIDCLVSLLTAVDRQRTLEVGMVGNEGMAGMPFILGVGISGVRALVQGEGQALRMDSVSFRAEFDRNPALQQALFRYTYALMAQVSQTAACNRFHDAGERLARWLLMTRDRIGADQFSLTHEFLAHMLGLRRVGVTEAASRLKRRKLIAYARGELQILNVPGLKRASCSCYRIVNAVFERAQRQ